MGKWQEPVGYIEEKKKKESSCLRINRWLGCESEAAQKAPRSLRHLKHACQFHVGEVWF